MSLKTQPEVPLFHATTHRRAAASAWAVTGCVSRDSDPLRGAVTARSVRSGGSPEVAPRLFKFARNRLEAIPRAVAICSVLGLCCLPEAAFAEPEATRAQEERPMALGVQVDLLPTILSASVGEVGGAGQIWLGIDRFRLRFIGAQIFVPELVHGQDGFSPLRTRVLATVVDYTFGPRYDRWWVSTGFELWLNRVELEATGAIGEWESVIWTLGGGYIWRFAGNFYLDPWVAVHVPLNNRSRLIGDERFKSWPVQPEVSLKIGWFFDL